MLLQISLNIGYGADTNSYELPISGREEPSQGKASQGDICIYVMIHLPEMLYVPMYQHPEDAVKQISHSSGSSTISMRIRTGVNLLHTSDTGSTPCVRVFVAPGGCPAQKKEIETRGKYTRAAQAGVVAQSAPFIVTPFSFLWRRLCQAFDWDNLASMNNGSQFPPPNPLCPPSSLLTQRP